MWQERNTRKPRATDDGIKRGDRGLRSSCASALESSMTREKDEEIPKDLTELEYARHILENTLGWPAKGNLETVADCIRSISRCKRLPTWQAYKYLVRAVTLATEQGVLVSKFWLQDGEYMRIRPTEKERKDRYDLEGERAKNYAAHGCNSGWVYVEGGVRRCEKCVGK